MDHKCNLALSGKKLNRSAHLRVDGCIYEEKFEASRFIFSWRGKILLIDPSSLFMCDAAHGMVKNATKVWFLGQIGDQAYFCVNVPDWPLDTDKDEEAQSIFDSNFWPHPVFPQALGFVDFRNYMTLLSESECELVAAALGISAWQDGYCYCPQCGGELVSKAAGWSKTCSACGRSHFPRTDPVAITLVTHGNDVLVGRGKGWPEGLYSLLAGFVEPGETIEAAAAREVYEEAGVEVADVKLLFSQPWPFPASLMVGCQAQAITREIAIDPEEIEEAIWVSRERMFDVFAGLDPQIKPPRSGAIATYILKKWVADAIN